MQQNVYIHDTRYLYKVLQIGNVTLVRKQVHVTQIRLRTKEAKSQYIVDLWKTKGGQVFSLNILSTFFFVVGLFIAVCLFCYNYYSFTILNWACLSVRLYTVLCVKLLIHCTVDLLQMLTDSTHSDDNRKWFFSTCRFKGDNFILFTLF